MPPLTFVPLCVCRVEFFGGPLDLPRSTQDAAARSIESAEGAPRPRTHDGAVALPGMHDSTRAAQAARLVRLKPPERAWLACSQGWKEADVVSSKGDAAWSFRGASVNQF